MIKVGVVGAGHLGKWHIKNLQDLETAELVGFYDLDSNRSKEIAEEYKTRAFSSLTELLEACAAISIVVPTNHHYAIAQAALEQGLHVFCEKPFMETLPEAETIIRLAKSKKRVLQVGHIERFNPALTNLKQFPVNPLFIESHRIAPFNPRGTDVAVVLDLMIHDIDIILALVRSPVQQIDAAGAPVLTKNIDIANARIRFENSCVANITASRVSHKQMRKLRIFQYNAYISIDFLKNTTEVYRLSDEYPLNPGSIPVAQLELEPDQKRTILYEQLEPVKTNAMLEELRAFIQAIEQGQSPPVTGEDGKKALEIAIQIETQINSSLGNIL